ncbi:MAG: hypothetical protein IJ660_07015 [Alphaproteobacteria bacterium]|nr:hypothetical protein [Alphaproteobacteria bacterium]
MSESVTQKNLLLFSEILFELNKASRKAYNRGHHFLPIYQTYRVLQPYINNLSLYCQKYLDKGALIKPNQPQELFDLVQDSQQMIENIHEILMKQNFPNVNCNFYIEEARDELGRLLIDIDHLPKHQRIINRYFMRGMLEAATAIMLNRRQNSESAVAKNINESEIPEKFITFLAEQGVAMNDDNETSVYEILYQECGELISQRAPVQPKELSQSIAHSMHKYFSVNEQNIRKNIEKDSETLCGFIKEAKKHMRRHQSVVRELMLFAQNIDFIPHEKAENCIYEIFVPNVAKIEKSQEWRSDKPMPQYLLPFAETPDVLLIKQQMPQWERYEQDSQNFDKKAIYHSASLMSLSLIKSMYRELDEYEEILDELSEIKEDEEEDGFRKIDNNVAEREKYILDFTEKLVSATAMVEKYAQLRLNNTGIDSLTIDKMKHKDNLDMQDITILGEFISTIDNNIGDCLDVINMAVIPDYNEVSLMVQEMPHGKEKQEALTCLMSSMDVTSEDLCENLEEVVFNIDCQIGHQAPELENKFRTLVADTKRQYPELNAWEEDDLACKIHEGVVVSYLLPYYQKEDYNGSEAEMVAAYVDGYEDLSSETQAYLQQISRYYGENIVEMYDSKKKAMKPSQKVHDDIIEFYNCQYCLQEIDEIQQEVAKALTEEKVLAAAYHKYKTQKAKYELPDNINLVLTSLFNQAKRQR